MIDFWHLSIKSKYLDENSCNWNSCQWHEKSFSIQIFRYHVLLTTIDVALSSQLCICEKNSKDDWFLPRPPKNLSSVSRTILYLKGNVVSCVKLCSKIRFFCIAVYQIAKQQRFCCACYILFNMICIFSLLSWIVNSKSVIGVACGWMEVEQKQESRPLKDHHLVFIVYANESSLFDEMTQ